MYKMLFILTLVLLGCTTPQGGVQGGVLLPYSQLADKPDQVYAPGTCRNRDGTAAEPISDVEYEVRHASAPATLFEHSLNESEGRLIKNEWADKKGLHFFVWLNDVCGFEYVVPGNRQSPAERRVYRHPQLRRLRQEGHSVTLPIGDPDTICELAPTR